MENSAAPRRFTAVLWDLDDTLVDSMPARVQALSRVFRDVSIESVDPRGLLLSLEGTLDESLRRLAVSLGRPADLYERFKSIYWTKAAGSLRLYPGVEAVLDELSQRGVLLAVVTQKARVLEVEGVAAGASVELEDLGLTSRFPVVIGINDVREAKPHPEGILKALELLDVQPERALMVGDTVTDMAAAMAAGCWACLATWGIPDGTDRASRSSPDVVAETPGDILRFAMGVGDSQLP